MRQWMVTALILIVVVIVIVLHFVLFQSKMNKKIDELKAERDKNQAELKLLAEMEKEIPILASQLPSWQAQLGVYEAAIPSKIEDEVFFGVLTEQLKQHNVELIGASLSRGGSWLGEVTEAQAEQLTGMGVDLEAAKQVRLAFYEIRLNGEWSGVLNAFEGLKSSGRMYTIDEATSPSGGGGGTVSEAAGPADTGIAMTGKIFYGMPKDKVTADKLREAIRSILIRPMAYEARKQILRPVKKIAQEHYTTP
jgi:hypothetical protein